MEQIKTVMADLPVTVQLTYGDLKLLEEAKNYGTRAPHVINFEFNRQFYKAQILEELRKERKAVSAELWEDHDQLNAALPYIDRLIKRIEQLP